MKIFGVDPGSDRTGYGCVEMTGSRHVLVAYGALTPSPGASFPQRLKHIHNGLVSLLAEHRPDCVVVESIFHSRNVRSALKLGHARGVVLLAASEADLPVVEYSPAEIKRAVVGYGRAEKRQIQHMVRLLLGLGSPPTPHDAADALAVAICHLHTCTGPIPERLAPSASTPGHVKSWRDYGGPLSRRDGKWKEARQQAAGSGERKAKSGKAGSGKREW